MSAERYVVNEKDSDENKEEGKSFCARYNPLIVVNKYVIGFFENVFYKLGYSIGDKPWIFLLISLVFILLSCLGILRFHQENDSSKLWIPRNAQALKESATISTYFKDVNRYFMAIFEAENVLTKEFFENLEKFEYTVEHNITVEEKAKSFGYKDLCSQLGTGCFKTSPTSLVTLNENTTTRDIQIAITNNKNLSTIYFSGMEMKNDLVIKSVAVIVTFSLKGSLNFQDVNPRADSFEEQFAELCLKGITNSTSYCFTQKGNIDASQADFEKDQAFLYGGFILVGIFVFISLGRFNCRDFRVYPSIAALFMIVASIFVANGLSSLLGFSYSTIHTLLPFLTLGIGIDDVFIIVGEFENNRDVKSLPIRAARTLKRSGLSLLVTTFTDIVAFGIGYTSQLNALRSFCMFCAVAIAGVFILTLFLVFPIVIYDQMRANLDRNFCLCCIRFKDYVPNKYSEIQIVQLFLKKYFRKIILSTPCRVVIIVSVLIFSGISIYGAIHLEIEADLTLFLKQDHFISEYMKMQKKLYPTGGIFGQVYTQDIEYWKKDKELMEIYNAMLDSSLVQQGSVEFWYNSFRVWLHGNRSSDIQGHLTDNLPSNHSSFMFVLKTFLNDQEGLHFNNDVQMTNESIIISFLRFKHIKFDSSSDEIDAMDEMRATLSKIDIEKTFVFANEYLIIEIYKTIFQELVTNLLLAFIAVVIMTLVLIADLLACIYVSTCVVLTLLDVMGFMYLWDLNIEMVSTICLVIAIGLAIDYAAHIAVRYILEEGTRKDKTEKSVVLIGPSVLIGAFAMFLAFSLLSMSAGYVFTVFFKIFFLVVFFGVFHGVLFLPVVLSLIGPLNAERDVVEDEMESPKPAQEMKTPESNSVPEQKDTGIENQGFNN